MTRPSDESTPPDPRSTERERLRRARRELTRHAAWASSVEAAFAEAARQIVAALGADRCVVRTPRGEDGEPPRLLADAGRDAAAVRHPTSDLEPASAAITDTGTMIGVLEVYRAAAPELDADEAEFLDVAADLLALAHQRLAGEKALAAFEARRDEFLAILGHELRNPLAAVDHGLKLLQQKAPPAQRTWLLDMMGQELEQLGLLIDDLLDVTRITRGKLKLRRREVAVAEIVDRAAVGAGTLLEQRGHELSVDVEPADLGVRADPLRLEQVVVNLLNNAAKYTPRGGHVLVRGRAAEDGVEIAVQDDGVGISPESLDSIFHPFFQIRRQAAARGGLGIGLTLVRQLIELHGGCIEVTSPGLGHGSTFTIRLPERRDGTARSRTEPRSRPSPAAGARVLVVDDNEAAAKSLGLLLQNAGCNVRVRTSGAGALGTVEEFAPQVALIDLDMPDVDGFEVARGIARVPLDAPCALIAITGLGHDEARAHTREAGFDHHLLKPIDLDHLLALIHASTRR